MTIYTQNLPVTGPALANFSFPEDDAVLVVGDVHGQNAAFRGVLEQLGRMPTPGKYRTLVLLGDLIDRGPDSLGALRTAFEDAQTLAGADRIVFLPGNHELLLADALDLAARNGDIHASYQDSTRTWLSNGGMSFMIDTFDAADLDMPGGMIENIRAFAELLPHPGFDSFGDMVRSWPSHFALGDLLCVHAGVAPGLPLGDTLTMDQDSHRRLNPGDLRKDGHWAWIRKPFLDHLGGWPMTGRPGDRGALVLHGHTAPSGLRGSLIECDDNIDAAFNAMSTRGRVCLDGGSAKWVGVAGAIVTSAGLRLAFQHC